MNTGTGQRNEQITSNERTAPGHAPGAVGDSAEPTQLPVPLIDEDDYAPTIIRGRE